VRVTLIITEDENLATQRTQRFQAEQRNGKFAFGLIWQVVQAAVGARQDEIRMFKELIDSVTPLLPFLRSVMTGELRTEDSAHHDHEKPQEGAMR
jgi:hypothetical protein